MSWPLLTIHPTFIDDAIAKVMFRLVKDSNLCMLENVGSSEVVVLIDHISHS
jgi:hypothetical protein